MKCTRVVIIIKRHLLQFLMSNCPCYASSHHHHMYSYHHHSILIAASWVWIWFIVKQLIHWLQLSCVLLLVSLPINLTLVLMRVCHSTTLSYEQMLIICSLHSSLQPYHGCLASTCLTLQQMLTRWNIWCNAFIWCLMASSWLQCSIETAKGKQSQFAFDFLYILGAFWFPPPPPLPPQKKVPGGVGELKSTLYISMHIHWPIGSQTVLKN